jgi:hypothetical protein
MTQKTIFVDKKLQQLKDEYYTDVLTKLKEELEREGWLEWNSRAALYGVKKTADEMFRWREGSIYSHEEDPEPEFYESLEALVKDNFEEVLRWSGLQRK